MVSKEAQEAINVLWRESLRLNSGAAYEATHVVLKLLGEAETSPSNNSQKIIIVGPNEE